MFRLRWTYVTAAFAALLAPGETALADRTCFALESQAMQLQARGVDRSQAARLSVIRERLARAGCGGGRITARSASVESRPQRSGRTFRGQSAPRSHALRRPAQPAPQREPEPSLSATYRTMCVRSCDGYYFPISFSTTRDRFGDDAETCARMCPGAEVGLYYHSVSDELPAEMISVDGAPYSVLPNAFRYRESLKEGCTCGSPAFEEADAEDARQDPPGEEAFATLPRPRPAPAQDPETVANRLGGFITNQVEPAAFASASGRFGRPVRVVGPTTAASSMNELLLRPVSE